MSEKPRMGRPPIPDADRRRVYGVSMRMETVTQLRELAESRQQSQGDVIAELVARALIAERKKRRQ